MILYLRIVLIIGVLACCLHPCLSQQHAPLPGSEENLIVNGGFEQGTAEWLALWTREPGVGKAVLDREEHHGGAQALRIEHSGTKDWSLAQQRQLDVTPGGTRLSAWVRMRGTGSVAERDHARCRGQGAGVEYREAARETPEWRPLQTRFLIPPGVATMQCRLTGDGPATVWLDDMVLTRQGQPAMHCVERDCPPR